MKDGAGTVTSSVKTKLKTWITLAICFVMPIL